MVCTVATVRHLVCRAGHHVATVRDLACCTGDHVLDIARGVFEHLAHVPKAAGTQACRLGDGSRNGGRGQEETDKELELHVDYGKDFLKRVTVVELCLRGKNDCGEFAC